MGIMRARAGQDASGATETATAVGFSDDRPVSRRLAVKWGVAAAAGAATLAVTRPDGASAAGGDNFVLGESNDADQITLLSSPAISALQVINTDKGDGVQGFAQANNKSGVLGSNGGDGPGVTGTSLNGPGVYATSQSNDAIFAVGQGATSRGVRGIAHSSSVAGVEGDNGGPGPGVFGSNTDGTGCGVIGQSSKADGVQGFSSATGRFGVLGQNGGSGAGVLGVGVHGTGVIGRVTLTGDGVVGLSGDQGGTGVTGRHTSGGPGVKGTSVSGIGVLGTVSNGLAAVEGDNSGSGPGVKATNSGTGYALQVVGTVQFQGVAGSGIVSDGSDSATVSNGHVTANSVISVTLMGAPGTGHGKGPHANVVLQWVERQPGSGFTVHLTDAAAADVPFTYLIVEP
jgi:hypothetical protein